MKKYLLYSIFYLVVLVSVTGCSISNSQVETDEEIMMPDETDEEAIGEAADIYQAAEQENLQELGELVKSDDEVYQVLIPSGWELCETKIEPSMLFELQGESEEQYMGILVLDKATYGEIDLAVFMETYIDNARENYGNAIMGETLPVDVNGNPAYSLKISGTADEIDYVNHIYIVDYENEKVVFTASAYPANEQLVADKLEDVVFSFGRVIPEDREELPE